MIFDATVDGQTIRVEVRGKDGRHTVVLDGHPLAVDARETGRHFLSLLIDGRSYEAGIEKRPGGYTIVLDDDAVTVDLAEAAQGAVAPVKKAGGPARIVAPMPGKLVRVLVTPAQAVEAGRGLGVCGGMTTANHRPTRRGGPAHERPPRDV